VVLELLPDLGGFPSAPIQAKTQLLSLQPKQTKTPGCLRYSHINFRLISTIRHYRLRYMLSLPSVITKKLLNVLFRRSPSPFGAATVGLTQPKASGLFD
jgi:hypothetical protein